MFDLEQAVTEWRQRMTSAGIASADVLDELEGHLRDQITSLRASGMSEADAFDAATARLGNPGLVQKEFDKVAHATWLPVKVASFGLVIVAIVMAIPMFGRHWTGKRNPLLIAHILILTAGCVAAFLPGGFGIGYLLCLRFLAPSISRQRSLFRAVVTFVYVSAGLVSIGVFLGILWSDQFRGVWFNTGPRVVGPMCIFAWLITMAFVQRFRPPSEKMTVLLAIAGNIVVSLAWFGALIVAAGKSNDGIADHPWLALWIGIHLAILALGGRGSALLFEKQG